MGRTVVGPVKVPSKEGGTGDRETLPSLGGSLDTVFAVHGVLGAQSR